MPRSECELTPTETRNGANNCQNEAEDVMCCSETVCQVADAKGYCGIEDKCIKKGLVSVSDMVYGGIAVGCRHLPDDVKCCVEPKKLKCSTDDSNQYQGMCTAKLACLTSPMDTAVLNGVKNDIKTTCHALDESLTCCIDDVPCSGKIDESIIGKCEVVESCYGDSRILYDSKGCENTDLICCVPRETDQDESDKCDDNDLTEIQKTRASCTSVIGGTKKELEDNTTDYGSCLCEEVEDCTFFFCVCVLCVCL